MLTELERTSILKLKRQSVMHKSNLRIICERDAKNQYFIQYNAIHRCLRMNSKDN